MKRTSVLFILPAMILSMQAFAERPACCDNGPVSATVEDGYETMEIAERPAAPLRINGDPFCDLMLTEAQKERVLKASRKREAKNLKLQKKLDKERAKTRMEFDKEIRNILSPDQYSKFKQNLGEHKIRRAHKAQGIVKPSLDDSFVEPSEGYAEPAVGSPKIVKGPSPQIMTEKKFKIF